MSEAYDQNDQVPIVVPCVSRGDHVADMPKGRGCDRKQQAKENWIRVVALLRL